MRRALVVGASRGIGLATVRALLAEGTWQVAAACRNPETAHDLRAVLDHPHALGCVALDVCDEAALAGLPDTLAGWGSTWSLIINCAGVLHGPDLQPEKALRQLTLSQLQQQFSVNAFGPILLARAVEALIPRQEPSWFVSLSARVGSIEDNHLGGWYSYRAAKSAQNQLLRTLSIEWRRSRPQACVLAFHPGTVDTDLSRPFQRPAPGKVLFTPDQVATYLLTQVLARTASDTGSFVAWDGQRIPW